ncbi:DUF397 domain-containing protein [Sphaerisporangium corydalis]|uniref:DUF397 domain-containing protein n=1 Tax=Sphaerisporangium corydalis TaxID=1441875 RepID=A0ABV9ERC4_9ACTN|nr:DUF397 domain-containing protein [Sphaerisporangium corydalis]
MDLSAAKWRKSTWTGDNGGNCVEVAELSAVADQSSPGTTSTTWIAVRDSKNPEGPKLYFTPAEWDAFLDGVKASDFNRE